MFKMKTERTQVELCLYIEWSKWMCSVSSGMDKTDEVLLRLHTMTYANL